MIALAVVLTLLTVAAIVASRRAARPWPIPVIGLLGAATGAAWAQLLVPILAR